MLRMAMLFLFLILKYQQFNMVKKMAKLKMDSNQ